MTSLTADVAGLVTKNPVWVGSSELTMSIDGIRACVDAGAGAVVAKSVNESPAARDQLDIADYVYLDDGHEPVVPPHVPGTASMFNRSGLAQQSLDDWLAMLDDGRRHAADAGSVLIGSITAADPDAAADLAAVLGEVVPAVEVNVGAPHGREAAGGAVRQLTDADAVNYLVGAVRRRLDAPLLIKLPGMASDVGALVAAAERAGADAVTLTGRFNGFLPSLDTQTPLLGSWGAYGGPWALPMSLHAVSKAFRAHRGELPLVGSNGARDAGDVVRFLLSGASAVEMVSAVWIHGPEILRVVLDDLHEHLSARGTSVAEIRGLSVATAKNYADVTPIRPRPEPWLTTSPIF